MDKQDIRDQIIASRIALPAKERTRANRAITESVVSLSEIQAASVICIYISLPEEVDTTRLIDRFLQDGKTVVLPKIAGGRLMLTPIDSRTDLRPNALGILEPVTGYYLSVAEIDVFLVPGVGFDRAGNRLGWGKGYYDKLLEKTSAPKIGLAYACQIVSRLPVEKYDIPMDTVITEKETIESSHAGSPQG